MLLHFQVDKMKWESLSQIFFFFKFEWGTPTLENPEIAGKPGFSSFSDHSTESGNRKGSKASIP
jgi:hypothetical protein